MRSLIARAVNTAEKRGATITNPSQQWGTTAPPTNGQLGMSVGGVTVSDQTAMQLAAVYGSVSIIADAIATLPIRQWRLKSGEAVAMTPSPVIAQPSPEITQRDFVIQGSTSYLLRGNLYGEVIARDNPLMFPSSIKLIHPDHAKVKRNQSTGAVDVYYWNKLVTPADNVTRGMALQLPEGIVGLNPIEYMRNVMGLARAQDLYSGAFYANSARPDGIITVKGQLDTDEAKALKSEWLSSMQGINASHLPAVLTETTTYTPISMSMVDVQFLEQMQYSAMAISGMIYRVPPHMLGMIDKTTSWGAGVEQQELGFVRNTLLIWLNRWEDLMTSWLPPGQFVTFDLSERLRGDTLQRWAAYQIARVIGAMTNAQIIKEEGGQLPTTEAQLALLNSYDQPFNSSPMPAAVTQGGDKAN